MAAELPAYAERLSALHDGLAAEFKEIIARIPALGGARVLDAGCGDGFFTQLLAPHVGGGTIEALDSSAAYLQAAGERLRNLVDAGRVRLVQGNVLALPFDAGAIDVVLSAHSMQSYDDLPAVLAEFRRVLRPGGVLAILETDALHSIMLPWPPRLELALREAERCLLADADDRMGAYFPRYAKRLLGDAGFIAVRRDDCLCTRPAPLPDALAKYARLYIDSLVEGGRERLDAPLLKTANEFAARFAAGKPGEDFLSLQTLLLAQTPPT